MSTKTIWVIITALLLGVAISLFMTGIWILKITYNTLEYTEHLKSTVEAKIQDTVERVVEVELAKPPKSNGGDAL